MAKVVLAVRLEPWDKQAVADAAARKHMTLSEYAYAVLLRAAKNDVKEATQ